MSETHTALTERSPLKILVFSLFSLGLYWIYYLHQLNTELREATGADYNPATRTLMCLIPLVNFYGLWQIGQSASEVNDDLSGAMAFLGLLIPIPFLFLFQPKLNAAA